MLVKLINKLKYYLRTTKHYRNVRKFHKLARQDAPDILCVIPEDGGCILRAKLVLEEAMELIQALGVTVTVCSDKGNRIVNIGKNTNYKFRTTGQLIDCVEIADGCADLTYVSTGTLVAFGIPDKEIQNEVDKNNLDKFKDGWSIRSDGKVIKSFLWQPPKINNIIMKYYQEGNNKNLSLKNRIKFYFVRLWRSIKWG